MPISLCPCGSQKTYEQCCGLYLEKKQIPLNPEQLMRSRYTAYSLAKIDYIIHTMQGKPLVGFNELDVKAANSKIIWIGLDVLQSYLESPDKGFVEFRATFLEHNQLKNIHELSEFHKINNTWFYVDGSHQQSSTNNNKQKIARNSPCPCGSGKKFKNCHDK